jgi:molybdate transport system substrate-binding protein
MLVERRCKEKSDGANKSNRWEEMTMRRKIGIILLVLLVSVFSLITAAAKEVELYVAAAASLTDVMTELQSHYRQKHPEIKIYLNLASSGKLQTQIEQGAPADLFVSAAQKQMDALEKQALIKRETRINLLENQLVMIVPKDSKLPLKSFTDLGADTVKKVGIGAPESVPAGQYAKEVLSYLKIWDRIQGRIVLGANVRAVLTYVETGNVDAGIVYRTDAAVSDQVRIVAAAPKGSHEPIVYPAAVLAGAKQPQAAAEFLKYLDGKDAARIFEKYGFLKAQ